MNDFEQEVQWEESPEERQRRERRRARIAQMKREKRRAEIRRKMLLLAAVVILVGGVLGIGISKVTHASQKKDAQEMALEESEKQQDATGNLADGEDDSAASEVDASEEADASDARSQRKTEVFTAEMTSQTAGFEEEITSEYGVVIDVEAGEILAEKGAHTRISPASMTKILTVLVAADALGITTDADATLDETFVITREITDYSFSNDCSNVGFEVGEAPTVRDLFYGTILPSGADAAMGLAFYVAGSKDAFMDLMNAKLKELGLSDSSHFTNCVGIYDADHYSTVYDMAVIMKTATDNEFLRGVLSARTYETSTTAQHTEGLLISNWFLRRIEDKDTHGVVLCAKTGFVVQSKSCAASLAADGYGKEYICVTAGAGSSWQCIYDHVALYQKYLDAGEADALAIAE